MNIKIWFITLGLCFAPIFADTIYIVGGDQHNAPTYWTVTPPNPPSSGQELPISPFIYGPAYNVAFSPTGVAYIVGQINDSGFTAAAYWTVSSSGVTSDPILLGNSDLNSPLAYNIAFNPSGVGYIIGTDAAQNAAYWTISNTGTLHGPFELPSALIAQGIAFSSTGAGYIAGLDSSDNACYWTLSNTGVIAGPFDLLGGESGGSGDAYAIAISPSGTTYIVGSNTGGFACYWTIPNGGSPSSANILDGGSNSVARGVAFLPSGDGIIAGQTAGNVSSYWTIAPDGTVSTFNALPNGSGAGSSAYDVAFDVNQTAYIVGADNGNNGVYWTVPISGTPVEYNLLEDNSIAYGIAIPGSPNSPTTVSGEYVINDFALLYENCAVINWTPSDSNGVVSYNIYKNGVLIVSVNSSTTQYQDHNQIELENTVYGVTAVNSSGTESSPPTTVTLN